MVDMLVQDDPLIMAQQQFDMIAERMRLEDGMRQILRLPSRELATHFPVLMDDGSTRVFTGYRVQHNVARGPAKGVYATRRSSPSTRSARSLCG